MVYGCLYQDVYSGFIFKLMFQDMSSLLGCWFHFDISFIFDIFQYFSLLPGMVTIDDIIYFCFFIALAAGQVCLPQVCPNLGSRALSMMALACFRTGRPHRLDELLNATRLVGLGIGASGYSAAVMAAEQGDEAEREIRILEVTWICIRYL